MAVSTLRLSVEEKNYWKFCMLNVRVVPDALRNYFDGLIQPSSLATTINRYSTTILKLVTWKVINAAQLNILQRIPGTIWPAKISPVPIGSTDTSSAHFDVTLMVCLLRNIPLPGIFPPVTGWDNLPHPHDLSPGAYLATIKYYRNEIAHSTENNLHTVDFQNKWKALSEAIKFVYGGNSPIDITDILHCDLDGSHNGDIVAALSTEIDEIKNDLKRTELQLENIRGDFHYYKDGNLPKNISDNINDLINVWRKDDEPYFVTRATKQVYDILESENIVMVIGHSGSGKSAVARNAALKYHSKGYDVVPVESVYNILDYRCKDKKQIFVIDDVVGKYSINGTCLYQWERLDSKLQTLFVDHNAKLICTLRKVLATDPKFRQTNTLFSENAYIIDLDNEDNCLLSEEKMSVLKNHLTCTGRQNDLSYEECKECCKANFAFPLLCHVFTTSGELFKRKSSFFRKPLCYVNGEIAKLHKRNKVVYCSLVICMIYSGKLSTDIFSVSDNSREERNISGRILGMISEACGLHRNISRQTLLDSLHYVEGVYVNMSFGKINFVHDFFLEAISVHFSKVNICVLLKCCDNDFLMQRVRVISPNVNDDQNVIVLEEKSYFHLACRFIDELKKGFFLHVLWSQPIKQDKFLKVMFNLIDRGHIITKQTLMKSELTRKTVCDNRFFTPVIRQGFETYMVVFPAEKTFLHWIICNSCLQFFDYFWKSMSMKQQHRFVHADKSIFPLTLLSGCKEIIKQMVDAGADVNSPGSHYALQMLVLNERNTEVIEFLMRNGIAMNFTDYNRKSPLFYAITYTNLTVHAFLVENDSKQNPLHAAVYNSNIFKTKHLLSSRNIKWVSNNGWSVFHFAAYNNDIAMMDIIFETAMTRCKKSDQNDSKTPQFSDIVYAVDQRDINGWTPLHLASILCYNEAVDFLMSKGANAHLVDLDGKTPLHLSSSGRITSSLLEKNHREKEFPHTKCRKPCKKERHSFEEEDHANDMPENMKNWHPSSFSLIYVTCMNILFLCFSIVKFRKKIDIPDREGNTLLHAAANIKSDDESIESVQMLLERGANPLFYNSNGYMPTDVASKRSSNKLKLFLDTYLLHALKRRMWVLVVISILTFLLVVSLCLAPLYISPGFLNDDVNNNPYIINFNTKSYDFSIYLQNAVCPNSYKLYILSQNIQTVENLRDKFPKLYVIHLVSILFVLCFDIVMSLCQKLLCRHTYSFEIIYKCVYLIAIIHVMSLSDPVRSIVIVLKDIIVFFFLLYICMLVYVKLTILFKEYNLEWLVLTSALYKCIVFIIFPVYGICFGLWAFVLLPRLLFIFGTLLNYSMMSLFSTFIITFIGIHIYMNVFSGCAYLILLNICGRSGFFRHLSEHLHFKILKVLRILINKNPSVAWHFFFKFFFLYILLFIETIFFYDTFQEVFLFRNMLNKMELINETVAYFIIYIVTFIGLCFDVVCITVSIKGLFLLQRFN